MQSNNNHLFSTLLSPYLTPTSEIHRTPLAGQGDTHWKTIRCRWSFVPSMHNPEQSALYLASAVVYWGSDAEITSNPRITESNEDELHFVVLSDDFSDSAMASQTTAQTCYVSMSRMADWHKRDDLSYAQRMCLYHFAQKIMAGQCGTEADANVRIQTRDQMRERLMSRIYDLAAQRQRQFRPFRSRDTAARKKFPAGKANPTLIDRKQRAERPVPVKAVCTQTSPIRQDRSMKLEERAKMSRRVHAVEEKRQRKAGAAAPHVTHAKVKGQTHKARLLHTNKQGHAQPCMAIDIRAGRDWSLYAPTDDHEMQEETGEMMQEAQAHDEVTFSEMPAAGDVQMMDGDGEECNSITGLGEYVNDADVNMDHVTGAGIEYANQPITWPTFYPTAPDSPSSSSSSSVTAVEDILGASQPCAMDVDSALEQVSTTGIPRRSRPIMWRDTVEDRDIWGEAAAWAAQMIRPTEKKPEPVLIRYDVPKATAAVEVQHVPIIDAAPIPAITVPAQKQKRRVPAVATVDIPFFPEDPTTCTGPIIILTPPSADNPHPGNPKRTRIARPVQPALLNIHPAIEIRHLARSVYIYRPKRDVLAETNAYYADAVAEYEKSKAEEKKRQEEKKKKNALVIEKTKGQESNGVAAGPSSTSNTITQSERPHVGGAPMEDEHDDEDL